MMVKLSTHIKKKERRKKESQEAEEREREKKSQIRTKSMWQTPALQMTM